MINLMIVDDDEIICRGIAACIDWSAHGIRVIDTAFDGETALEKVRAKSPDIMLVDINMPFMDGLELAYEVREENASIKIILLTAYHEFEYAKKAIELQVFEYLSKPFSNEEVLQAVCKAARVVQAERSYRQEIEENRDIIRQTYLSQIVSGHTKSPEKIRWCGLETQQTSYAVGVLLTNYIYPEETTESLNEILLHGEVFQRLFLEEVGHVLADRREILYYPQGEWVVLLFRSCTDADVKTQAADILQAVGKQYGYCITLGIGRCYQGTEQIPCSYDEAKYALDYRKYYGSHSIIHIDEIQDRIGQEVAPFPMYRRQILESVRDGDIAQVQQITGQLLEHLAQTHRDSLPTLSIIALEVLVTTYKATGDEKIFRRFLEDCLPHISKLGGASGVEDLCRAVEQGLGYLTEDGVDKEHSDLERIIEQATAYIDANYANPDLSLKMVATHVHISVSYLCILFRQIKQTSYINYLNRVRMENAKQLLRKSGIKTYEIAFAVGFNSAQYFASSFKKYTGKTPSEFRSEAKI